MHGLCHDAAVFSRDGSAVFSRDGGRCNACGKSSSAPAHRKKFARESGVAQEVFNGVGEVFCDGERRGSWCFLPAELRGCNA
jgi:hypothetical protein